jgi:L-threonylcarbamoyladenylate synthase
VISDPIGQAVRWVRGGGLLAYPTETVWGLGASADSEAAVERLRLWKGRDDVTPLSVLIAGPDQAEALGCELGAAAQRLAAAFWPGPLTLVVPCRHRFAPGVARGDGALGLRCSSHPLAAYLARRLRREGAGPLTATSLNRSGEPPAASRAEAQRLCADEGGPRLLDVEGAESGGERASTVVDLTGKEPRVLRWGGLSRDDLETVLEEAAP